MHASSLIFAHPTKLLLHLILISFAEPKWNRESQNFYRREWNSIGIYPSHPSKPAENLWDYSRWREVVTIPDTKSCIMSEEGKDLILKWEMTCHIPRIGNYKKKPNYKITESLRCNSNGIDTYRTNAGGDLKLQVMALTLISQILQKFLERVF